MLPASAPQLDLFAFHRNERRDLLILHSVERNKIYASPRDKPDGRTFCGDEFFENLLLLFPNKVARSLLKTGSFPTQWAINSNSWH